MGLAGYSLFRAVSFRGSTACAACTKLSSCKIKAICRAAEGTGFGSSPIAERLPIRRPSFRMRALQKTRKNELTS